MLDKDYSEYVCKIPNVRDCDGLLDCTECPYFRKRVGRPIGSKKAKTVPYYRRVRAEWIVILDKLLKKLKEQVK